MEKRVKEHPPRVHEPVLLRTMLEVMQPSRGENYLDLTAGYGGHADGFIRETENFEDSVLVDRDDNTARYLQKFVDKGTKLLHTDFATACKQLAEQGKQFDIIIADLGVSSPQLDIADRGFSFSKVGPLDMRMDQTNETTAADIVNTYSVDALVDVIVRYGEEPKPLARRISKAIVQGRPYATTAELAEVIKQTIRSKPGKKKIHPATRTFQALRIEVNDELGQIEEMLQSLPSLLKPGGRAGIISFHSLEDRLVKRSFAEQAASGYEAELDILTRKPILGATEDVHNPRARSAKLRVARKK